MIQHTNIQSQQNSYDGQESDYRPDKRKSAKEYWIDIDEEYKKPSMAECELCEKLKDTRDLKLYNVEGRELYLCQKCGNKVSDKNIKTPENEDEAIKHIRMRYAKGEITKEQYEQMKKDLRE